MKFKIILSVSLFVSLNVFAQTNNVISLYFSPLSNAVDIHHTVGDFGYDSKQGLMYGVGYTRELNKSIALETGFEYTFNQTQISSIGPRGNRLTNGDFKIITVPALLKLSFLKYFYVDAGLLADIQINHTNNPIPTDQTGLGYQFGVGGRYRFHRIELYINPFAQYHKLVSFTGPELPGSLIDAGVKFGVGYRL